MTVIRTFIFFLHLVKTSIKESYTTRRSFMMQALLMLLNNMIFFTIWWFFFHHFNDIAGWKIHDLYILVAIGAGAYGLMQICFGNIEYLSRIVMRGDLDSFMTQPKNVLIHVISSKSLARGYGDLLTTVVLIFLGGLTAPSTIFLIIIGIISGCLVFTSIGIIAHSLVFWLGNVESLSQKYCDLLVLCSLYPSNIYSGVLQIVMFTLIPAGIIGFLPVELIRNFSWLHLLILVASAASFFTLAFVVFYRGLQRYQSGNQIGGRY